MKLKRGGIILAVIALVALAVAVPVVAGSYATPGGAGTLNFVNINQYGPDWQSVPPLNPRGPVGVMGYTASVVTTHTIEPQEIVKFSFTGARLSPGVAYTLVNNFNIQLPAAELLDVHILGAGIANRMGIVCIKGSATLESLDQFPGDMARVSGARVILVPTDELIEGADPGKWAISVTSGSLFSVLGIPLILPDNWHEE